jgi:hypothetical protein
VGGAVRRLRERRSDHHRPVHVGRAVEVERDLAPDAAAAPRLRRERPRALERTARAFPPARRAGEHPHRELHDLGAVLPSRATPSARRDRAPARRDDAEGPAAAQAGGLDARGSLRRRLPAVDRRRTGRSRSGHAARALLREDLLRHRRTRGSRVAVARLEQLYPFPVEQAAALLRGYPNLREVVWAQEEPQNMGAWRAIRHRLEEAKPDGVPLLYVGRPWRASPSEGYPTAHLREQDRIVRAALAPSALSA